MNNKTIAVIAVLILTGVASLISLSGAEITPSNLFHNLKLNWSYTEVLPNIGTSSTASEVNNYLILINVFITFALLVSICISFYLYKWRKILLANPQMYLPEEIGRSIDQFSKGLGVVWANLTDFENTLTKANNDNSDGIRNITQTLMTLLKSLDDKDQEIERLKKGYDIEIYRKFITRFIRVDLALNEQIEDGDIQLESLKQLKRLLSDALDACDVESFSPLVGQDYRSAKGVAENPKKQKTGNQEDEFKISEIIQCGYQLKNQSGYEIIIPAKVRIYYTEN